ncbi:MAG: SWIM zinc finger family protein, partial [candidate division KSB1 bacterium]|nr:SWIM zinc finger family protein [candidate division KSB1 bacterium]
SWDFYCGSYIRHPTVLGKRMSGLVGDEIDEYFAEVQVDGRQLKTGCSCGSRAQICKHAIALLYGWVHDHEGFQNVAELLERLRSKDKESIIAILGRILMYDHRYLSFLDEVFAEEDFEKDGL